VMDDDMYLDEYEYHRVRRNEGLTVEDVLATAAPYLVRSLLKKHQSMLLILGLADIALEVHRQYKSKKPMGKLILLHGDLH
jgi:hypothetical protein